MRSARPACEQQDRIGDEDQRGGELEQQASHFAAAPVCQDAAGRQRDPNGPRRPLRPDQPQIREVVGGENRHGMKVDRIDQPGDPAEQHQMDHRRPGATHAQEREQMQQRGAW
jgi:hypothetical protein